MTRLLPLQPIWTSLSGTVVLGCATATLVAGVGMATKRHTGSADGMQETLLVGSIDPDPGRRADRLDRLTADLAGNGSFTLHRLDPTEVERLADEPAGPTTLPLPELMEVRTSSVQGTEALALRLRGRPGIVAYPLGGRRPVARFARSASWLAILLSLSMAGWTAHHHLRRRAVLLLRLRRTGAASGQLLIEALAPVAASAGLGSLIGGLAIAAILPVAFADSGGAKLLAPPVLVTAMALLATLGSLRRLLAAQP